MSDTAAQDLRVQKPAYHLSLSTAPEEELTREEWGKVVDRVLRDLGLEEHQALAVAHPTLAVAEGPWTVARVTAPKILFAEPNGPRAVGGGARGRPPGGRAAGGDFVHLHPAWLASAAVPIAARDTTFRLGREQDPRGFALRHDGRVVGHLPWHHQELVAALNHLDALAPSPRALAAVLEAAGASALARVGALLARRTP